MSQDGKVRIYLADLVHTHLTGNYVVPLNIANIASYLLKELKNNDIEVQLFKYPSDLIKSSSDKAPHVIGLSNYFWNNNLNKVILTHIKKYFPNVLTVMGGPSIRSDLDGIKRFLEERKCLDFYVLFEGEKSFANLILEFMKEKGNIKTLRSKEIKGCVSVSWHRRGNLNLQPDHFKNLDVLPSPYLSGMLDKFLLDGLIPLFETSRGCPFSCTFCTWGIGALKKVRTFSTQRIFDEMEYVIKLGLKSPTWIFADANFGLFPRDVEIAKQIGNIKEVNHNLKKIVIWTAKNQPERNEEIARLIGDENPLVAIQTWDPIVQKSIKRHNISYNHASNVIRTAREGGHGVTTDILCGLPEETYESHLKTLRKAFNAGFDFIDVGNIIMLPGSEMETDEYREKYGIKTKYRLRQGSYGEYLGVKCFEYEEVIRSTSALKENEMLDFRMIHWLIWLLWNNKILSPFLLFLHHNYQINPVDFILQLINKIKESHFTNLTNFFNKFNIEAKAEWYNSIMETERHYYNQNNWNELLYKGFGKMNFSYTAEMMLNTVLRNEFFSFIGLLFQTEDYQSKDKSLNRTGWEIYTILKENYISPYEVFEGKNLQEKKYHLYKDVIPYFFPQLLNKHDESLASSYIVLRPNKSRSEAVKYLLIKHKFEKAADHAVQKVLEPFPCAFQYDILKNGYLAGVK